MSAARHRILSRLGVDCTITIDTKDVDFTIYAKGPETVKRKPYKDRVDMQLVKYKAKCRGDQLLWNAFLNLYQTRFKFVPQREAHAFIETCQHTHLSKTSASIGKSRIDEPLRLGKRDPSFADVVIMSVIYGHNQVRRRPWYDKWATMYNKNFEMPARIDNLFSTENLEPCVDKPLSTRPACQDKLGKCDKDESQIQKHIVDDEKDDEVDWMAQSMTSMTQQETPSPKVDNGGRRKSALNSEMLTQTMYETMPTNEMKAARRNVIEISSSPVCMKTDQSAMVLSDDDEDGDILDRPRPVKKPKLSSDDDEQDLPRSPCRSSETIELAGMKMDICTASDEQLLVVETSTDTPTEEKGLASTTASTTTEQVQDLAREAQTSMSQLNLSLSSESMLKQVKDNLARKQELVTEFEQLQTELAAKRAQAATLETQIDTAQKRLETVYTKLENILHGREQ